MFRDEFGSTILNDFDLPLQLVVHRGIQVRCRVLAESE